jgi:hypothetical protein
MLNKTATWPENEKTEFRKGMELCCMSPEESEEEENDSNSSETDEDEQPRPKNIIIRVRPLSWRSERFTNLLSSLDRKHSRKISERARAMTKKRANGNVLEQRAPDTVPAWMVKNTEQM